MHRALQTPRLILALLACALLAGCGEREGLAERPAEPGDSAVARVAGSNIYASDVKREAVAQGLVGEAEPLAVTSELFHRVLDEVVDQRLLAREAERRKLDDSETARRRLNAARERILGDMLVESVVQDAVREDAVRALYEEQRRLGRQEVEFRGRQIVSASEADAQAVVRLLAAGGDFNQLALERSIDAATRFNGGDLGYFNPKTLPPAYGLALQTAEPGQTLGPFRTEAGWVVLRVEDRRAEAPLTLEEARPQIIRFLTYDRIRQLLEDLERRGEVEVLVEAPKGGLQEPASAPRAANPPRPS